MQIRAVAHGTHRDIDPGSRLCKGRQICCDNGGRRIPHQNERRRDHHAHALQKVRQTLGGEYGLPRVAGAVQADHHTVSHQLVVPHAFNRHQILEPCSLVGSPERHQGQKAYSFTEVHGFKTEAAPTADDIARRAV